MEIGETWAYRERISDPDCPLNPVTLLKFGPHRSNKVRVRWEGGEYSGLDTWVPKIRLRVPWSQADAWLRDERLYAAAREASLKPLGTVEFEAAWLVLYAPGGEENIYRGWRDSEGAILHMDEPETTAQRLALDIDSLLAESLAFVDRFGQYVGPWSVAKNVALHVACRFPEPVLASVTSEEEKLREEAIHGRWFQWNRDNTSYTPAERCAEQLRERQPAFDLARHWCGAEAVERFDELARLREEVDRLRKLVEDTARDLEYRDEKQWANRLRRDMDKRGQKGSPPR